MLAALNPRQEGVELPRPGRFLGDRRQGGRGAVHTGLPGSAGILSSASCRVLTAPEAAPGAVAVKRALIDVEWVLAKASGSSRHAFGEGASPRSGPADNGSCEEEDVTWRHRRKKFGSCGPC